MAQLRTKETKFFFCRADHTQQRNQKLVQICDSLVAHMPQKWLDLFPKKRPLLVISNEINLREVVRINGVDPYLVKNIFVFYQKKDISQEVYVRPFDSELLTTFLAQFYQCIGKAILFQDGAVGGLVDETLGDYKPSMMRYQTFPIHFSEYVRALISKTAVPSDIRYVNAVVESVHARVRV